MNLHFQKCYVYYFNPLDPTRPKAPGCLLPRAPGGDKASNGGPILRILKRLIPTDSLISQLWILGNFDMGLHWNFFEFFVIEVHHLWTFKNGGALDIVSGYYWLSLCLYIVGLDTSGIELKASLHYVRNTTEWAIKMNDRSFVMFRCPGWVTSSRVFSTETVDYVFINEN